PQGVLGLRQLHGRLDVVAVALAEEVGLLVARAQQQPEHEEEDEEDGAEGGVDLSGDGHGVQPGFVFLFQPALFPSTRWRRVSCATKSADSSIATEIVAPARASGR